jgi:hypothetical protein
MSGDAQQYSCRRYATHGQSKPTSLQTPLTNILMTMLSIAGTVCGQRFGDGGEAAEEGGREGKGGGWVGEVERDDG